MNKKGFTLMEVMTVVIIVGILSSLALPQYRKILSKSRFTKAQVMAKAIHDACERTIAEWGVDSYSDLPSNVQALNRIIPAEDAPTGAMLSTTSLLYHDFAYTLVGECKVNIDKNNGLYRAKFVYNGTEFTCTEVDAEACNVYGLD
ncbi:MAG: prepilin-type N-terminal cleavage/methylation domain-containing protein [Elusimicrobiaceae bacterium]|nr:prepilin-type N-terminal cleavage/methylation domain-containing protein [Elusimicrobiaceae bacterium]